MGVKVHEKKGNHLCRGSESVVRPPKSVTVARRQVTPKAGLPKGCQGAKRNFAETAAVTAALAYGILEIVGSQHLAFWWPRQARTTKLGIYSDLDSKASTANSLAT